MEKICLDCGNIFYDAEAVLVDDSIKTLFGMYEQKKMTCPACGSDELEEAAHCEICGGSFLEEKLVDGYYCEDCLKQEITMENVQEYMNDPYALESFAEWLHEKRRK